MKIRAIISNLLITLALIGCAPFSEFQTAKTVGKGNVEITPFASTFLGVGNMGLNVDVGVSKRFDLRAGYSYLFYTNYGTGVLAEGPILANSNLFCVAPKISLIKNVLAFTAPIDLQIFPDYLTLLTVRPGLLLTIPCNRKIDFTMSPKVAFMLYPKDTEFIIPALGLGLSMKLSNLITLKPELGIGAMFGKPGEINMFNAYVGLGATFRFEKKKHQKVLNPVFVKY